MISNLITNFVILIKFFIQIIHIMFLNIFSFLIKLTYQIKLFKYLNSKFEVIQVTLLINHKTSRISFNFILQYFKIMKVLIVFIYFINFVE